MPNALIAIPTLNEEDTIAAVLSDLLSDCHRHPILVLDGGSTDRTCDIVTQIARSSPRVTLMQNPHRTQAYAMNTAAHVAQQQSAQFLVRVDAHARYPKGFVSSLLRLIQSKGADSVVTPLIATHCAGGWGQASAVLQRSWLGNGGAKHRKPTTSTWVDHGHHAVFRLSAYLALGGYNTAFLANEDAEYDHRLTAAGGRIYLAAQMPVSYVPRSTPSALFSQMWRNGFWRMKMLHFHGLRPALRQLLPLAATTVVPFSAVGALIWAPLGFPFLLYICAILLLSAHAANFAPTTAIRVAWLAGVMHVGFGLGGLTALRHERTRTGKRQIIT